MNEALQKERIIELYKNPTSYGVLDEATTDFHNKNALCGDEITVYLKIENDTVTKASFVGSGCALSTASSSLLMDEITGKSIQEIKALDSGAMQNLIGIPVGPVRLKCVLLALNTVKEAIEKV